MRRSIFLGLALIVTGLMGLGLAGRTGAAPQPPEPGTDPHHAMYEACAKVCADCMLKCDKTAHHCTESVLAGKKEHAKAMKVTADCAGFCALAAKMTASHSDLAAPACEACAKACDKCAAECEKFLDMPEMKACVELCKKCATSCREMAKH